MIRMLRRRFGREGFTLIELLLVVAIIGIIAAVLIPNLLHALHKSRQKRAMADIRSVGGAWFSWMTDQLAAGAAGAGQTYQWSDFDETITASELLVTLFNPDRQVYLQAVPEHDPWGTPLEFARATDPLSVSDHVMGIRSLGRDGVEDGSDYAIGPFDATGYHYDIVWADGFFVRWPVAPGQR